MVNEDPASAQPVGDPPPPRSKASGAAIGCGTVLALAIIGGVVSCASFLARGSSTDDAEVNRVGAQMACEDFVRDRLKAPASAKFSAEQASVTGVNKWSVTGIVDSQNSFGAMLRSSWTCSITLDGDTWHASTTIG